MPSESCSVAKFAEIIGVSRSTAWRIVRSGEIEYRRIRKRVVISKKAIEDFLRTHTVSQFQPYAVAKRLMAKH